MLKIVSEVVFTDLKVPQNIPTTSSTAKLLQIFFGVLAATAIVITTIAAILFALSRGDPQKAARARNAIIYSAVGIAVALSAEAIIAFVIGNV